MLMLVVRRRALMVRGTHAICGREEEIHIIGMRLRSRTVVMPIAIPVTITVERHVAWMGRSTGRWLLRHVRVRGRTVETLRRIVRGRMRMVSVIARHSMGREGGWAEAAVGHV